jgi:hypothetical protein
MFVYAEGKTAGFAGDIGAKFNKGRGDVIATEGPQIVT